MLGQNMQLPFVMPLVGLEMVLRCIGITKKDEVMFPTIHILPLQMQSI